MRGPRRRIVGLGDSTTAGTPDFLSPLEAPPNGRGNSESQYAYWMMRAHPEWTVLNRGINGQRSDEILARFPRDVLEERPDYAIILAGVNDVYQGRILLDVRRNLRAMYERSVEASIVPVAATILPYNTAPPAAAAAIRAVNLWIASAAENLTIPFCDTNRAAADPDAPDRLRGSPDGLHPDVPGYRAMGEALVRTIEEDLAGPRRR
ncbi:MAG: hypothetical protein HY557_04640 [Euryarchaeota archaeon]|nr:hypothetical protein [Euryarchaeota archaeon]